MYLNFRNVSLGARKPRSWFGPNGQYIRELPCPSCRGRGYTPCSECGIERSRSDCSQCVGKVCAFSKAYCEELLIDKIWIDMHFIMCYFAVDYRFGHYSS